MILHDVEQGTPEWADLRVGCITASQAHRLVTAKGHKPSASRHKYAAELAAEIVSGNPCDSTPPTGWMERGSRMEREAVALYQALQDVSVESVGFCTTDDGRCGASPDGMTSVPSGLEIKNLSLANHADHVRTGTPDDKHVLQCQFGLWVTGWDYWDVFMHNPALGPVSLRVLPDADLHAAFADVTAGVIAETDALVEKMWANQRLVDEALARNPFL